MMMVQQEQRQQQQQPQQQQQRQRSSGAVNTTVVANRSISGGTNNGSTNVTANVTVNVSSGEHRPHQHQQAHNSQQQQGPQPSPSTYHPSVQRSTTAGSSGRQALLPQHQATSGGRQHQVRVQPAGGVRRQHSTQQQQQQGQQGVQHGQTQGIDDDPEQQDEDSAVRRRRQRPLYRRIYQYVRDAWLGEQSTLDSELEDLETPPRYRPDSIEALCKATRFTQAEIKRIYRGFKAECPTGVVREDTFKMIYAQFFPQGANTSQYAHYVFNTLDQDHSGLISFEDFVQNLSTLSRGSLDDKLRWAFTLYDINGDGCITKEEMTDIVSAIYELMGKLAEPCIEEDTIKEKVDRIFQKMDKNGDGVVTLDEFLECCHTDEDISASMAVFDSAI